MPLGKHRLGPLFRNPLILTLSLFLLKTWSCGIHCGPPPPLFRWAILANLGLQLVIPFLNVTREWLLYLQSRWALSKPAENSGTDQGLPVSANRRWSIGGWHTAPATSYEKAGVQILDIGHYHSVKCCGVYSEVKC